MVQVSCQEESDPGEAEGRGVAMHGFGQMVSKAVVVMPVAG